MLCGWRGLVGATRAPLGLLPQCSVWSQHTRSLHKRIYKAKPYQTLHPVPKEPTTTVPRGPIDHPVIDLFTKQKTGTVQLDREIFGAPLRIDILQRVVLWHLDRRRQGTHKAKDRSEVRGGGRKPWRQKGTGRARIGSIRAPHWRGGGVTNPPRPRSHATDMPRKLRAFAIKVALSAKLAQGKLQVVENLNVPTHKTKELASTSVLPREWDSVLFVEKDEVNSNLFRAAANIRYVDTVNVVGVHTYDLLSRKTLVITKDAVQALQERIKMALMGKNGVALVRQRAKVIAEIAEHKKLNETKEVPKKIISKEEGEKKLAQPKLKRKTHKKKIRKAKKEEKGTEGKEGEGEKSKARKMKNRKGAEGKGKGEKGGEKAEKAAPGVKSSA